MCSTTALPGKKVILNDDIERPDTILPCDLLSFFVGPPEVGNTDFVNPVTRFGHLCRYFRLETETVLAQFHIAQHCATKSLKACLHVGKVEVAADIREQGQQFVAYHVPEINDAM